MSISQQEREVNLSDQPQQSQPQAMEVSNPISSTSESDIGETNTLTLVSEFGNAASHSGSVCEQMADHAALAEKPSSLLSSTVRDININMSSGVNYLPVSQPEDLEVGEAEVKDSCREMSGQESSSIEKPTCSGHFQADSKSVVVETAQSNSSSQLVSANVMSSNTGNIATAENALSQVMNCKSNGNNPDFNVPVPHAICSQNMEISHQGTTSPLTSLPMHKNVVPVSSELEPAQSNRHLQVKEQDLQTFIGPIAPDTLQKYVLTQGEMDVDPLSEERKQQTCHTESYDFSNRSVPTFVAWASTEYQRTGSENFLRGCKWSPDGSQLLTNSSDNILRVFNMSDAVLDNDNSSDIEQISEVLMREGSTVYDYAWIPCMSSHQPESFRIATTCSGIPIHLWDSTQGKIVASYKAFDQYDEITAAYSLSFSPSGSQVFGGYKKAIRVFDTEYPGRKCKLIKTCVLQPEHLGCFFDFCQEPSIR
ncbi:telomerase Cajal body protein 1 [Elysia marginata]|uniref:WD repeat-containing protein 79 n=1 Tax=Elysia marginata TaxID=1093978 RepID=A0AAV4JI93_9GAST|nr:telomerase Cajal body protein 1 [Elysia marginata]